MYPRLGIPAIDYGFSLRFLSGLLSAMGSPSNRTSRSLWIYRSDKLDFGIYFEFMISSSNTARRYALLGGRCL